MTPREPRSGLPGAALDILGGVVLAAVFVTVVKVSGMLTEAAVTLAVVAGAYAVVVLVRRRAARIRKGH